MELTTTDITVIERTIRSVITDGPVVTHEETIGGFGSRRGTVRTYRHRIESITAVKKDDHSWTVSLGVKRVKVDGTDSLEPRRVIGQWRGYSLSSTPEILAFRDKWLADQGIDDFKDWGH